MYESEFGLEWSTLSREAAITRAYALGVASSLGEEHPGELDRIVDEMGTAYGRSMVELSFNEGRTEANSYDSSNAEEIWTDLVEDRPPGAISAEQKEIDGIPESVTRIRLLDPPSDNLDQIRLPDFLFR